MFWSLACKCVSVAVSTVVHFERHSVRTGSFQTWVVVLAAQHWSTRRGLDFHWCSTPALLKNIIDLCMAFIFVSNNELKETFLQFSPRSWRGMKASQIRLVIHLLQPSWLYIWTRLRHFLWVRYLYPLCPCSCSAQCCFLCVWLSWGRAVTATCLTFLKLVALASSPVHAIAVWMNVANFIPGW